MRRLLPILGLLVMLTVPCLGENREKTYSIKCAAPFKITLPSDWVQIPAGKVSDLDRPNPLTGTYRPRSRHLCGFQHRNRKLFQKPYALVCFSPYAKGIVMTESLLARLISSTDPSKLSRDIPGIGRFSGKTAIVNHLVSCTYDREHHALVLEFAVLVSADRRERFKATLNWRFTRTGIIELGFYLAEDSFPKDRLLANRIARSIEVDKAFEVVQSRGGSTASAYRR